MRLAYEVNQPKYLYSVLTNVGAARFCKLVPRH